MGEADSDVNETLTVPGNTAPPAQPAPGDKRPRRGGALGSLSLLVALLALVVAVLALWRVVAIGRGEGQAANAVREDLGSRIDDIARSAEQRKRDFDTLRARLADADSVDKSVHEELLSLGERSRHLEDAVANLAEQRLTGRDALALNEAEFLLQLAAERLQLFHDPQSALAAYRLADSALAAAEDPVFAGVRQTIGSEMKTLEAAHALDTNATIGSIERIRTTLASLPEKTERPVEKETPATGFAALLDEFVHISNGEKAAPVRRDAELSRSLVAIDLRAAEAALLARDADAYRAALTRARVEMAAAFDADAAPVKSDLAEIDRLAAAPLAPASPDLGSALRDLRNLRATRALAQPQAVAPAVPPNGGQGATP